MKEELWLIQGNKPNRWLIPFYAAFEDESNALMFHAVPLLNRQQAAVEELLTPIAQKTEGMWRITRMALERVGRRCMDVVDPEALVIWEQMAPPVETKHPEQMADVSAFLDGLYQTGLFKDRSQLELIYYQICLHSLDWLINKEKPVDMYFLKLHNCPYRANWKGAMLQRFPRLGRIICHLRRFAQENASNEVGLLDELRCVDLLASAPGGTIQRTVEVEYKPLWHRTVLRVEKKRAKMLGPIKYANYVMESIARWSKVAVHCYVSWLNLIARPSCATVESGDSGEFRFVPHTPPEEVYRKRRGSPSFPVVVPNHFPKLKEASLAHDLLQKNGILSDEMPPVQPSAPDVRDRRPDLYRREDWRNKESRMLLLSATKGGNPL